MGASAVMIIGCGAGKQAPAPQPSVVASPSPPPVVSAARMDVLVGNAVRDGLRRLAVMSRPGGAADLGQALPTGLLHDVRCAPARNPTWRCDVAWRTVAGASEHTSYVVRRDPRTCFVALAAPPLAAVLDFTTRAQSDHPLNALTGVRAAC